MKLRLAFSWIALVMLAAPLAGCITMIPTPGKDIHKAAYTMGGNYLLVRNDDTEAWHASTITLSTNLGYFRQKAGDIHPGEVKQLALGQFLDPIGKPVLTSIQLKSVWVHTTYTDGRVVDELAFPAATFGLKPVTANTPPPEPGMME